MVDIYSYYMTQRPPQPGAMPRRGLQDILYLNADEERQYVQDIRREAYAILRYQRKLTEQEISDYELTPKE